MTEELAKTYNPTEFELELYQWWEKNAYFKPETQLELGLVDETSEPFCNTIPPPNVTGVLHLGHALTISIQDLMVRHARMKGRETLFVPGTDHAGIATQNVVERELNKQGIDRKDLGREKFINEVWKWKENSHKIISNQSRLMGMSSDWEREAFTMDENLSEAVRQAFVTLFDKKLIYRGNYLVNWCPGRCVSAISDLEAISEEVNGKLWYIKYPIKTDNWDGPTDTWGTGSWASGATDFIEIATTRPETLLGDTAIAVSPKNEKYKFLIGKTAILPVIGREIKIIEDVSVDPEFGTGALKITPAHDPNDYGMGKKHNLEFISIFDEKAILIKEYAGKYAGRDRFEARDLIVDDLEKEGILTKIEDHRHSIPHCQRCQTIIEPRNSIQWFVKTKPLADAVIQAVEEGKVNFIPSRFEEQFFRWMKNIRDWCISRQLWWGHRIPVWYCQNCEAMNTGLEDPSECSNCESSELKQDDDVLDTWFSSGLWPFSTLGWPKTTSDMAKFYPNSIRETGYDIIFFWVARELMLGLELLEQIPYSNVYFHGLVRNELGKKISKSMENIEEYDPLDIIAKYGADALRFTLVTNSAPGLDMNLDLRAIDAAQKFGNKIWQSIRYIISNVDPGEVLPFGDIDKRKLNLMDKWILSKLNNLILTVNNHVEEYNFFEAGRELKRFYWNVFCDWYLESTKLRIYDDNADKNIPNSILIHIVDVSLRLLHPFIPFITEKLWQSLPTKHKEVPALILAKWPTVDEKLRNDKTESDVQFIIEVITKIRALRSEFNISHKTLIPLYINTESKKDIINKLKPEIQSFAKIDSTELKLNSELNEDEKLLQFTTNQTLVSIPVRDFIDVDLEVGRIDKSINLLQNSVKGLKAKLESEFVERAPEEVVNKERVKLEKYETELMELSERRKLLA